MRELVQHLAEVYSIFRKYTMVSKFSFDAVVVFSCIFKVFSLAIAGNYPEAYVVVLEGSTVGVRHCLRESNSLGRTKVAVIMLFSPSVSRMHVEIYAFEGDYWICDLGTTNSMIVNGVCLGQVLYKFSHGDEIVFGDV
jgi:FOG: FHA domain